MSMIKKTGKQRGAVLIVALLMLLVMTILGVSGVGNSLLEERMSGNYRQSQASFQSAEFALNVAEDWLTTNVTSGRLATWFSTGGGDSRTGLYSHMLGEPDKVCQGDTNPVCEFDPRTAANWCAGGAGCPLQKGFVTLGSNDLNTGALPAVDAAQTAFQPQFVIEYLGQYSTMADDSGAGGGIDGYSETSAAGDVFAFKITVIGWGREANVRTVLLSTFHSPLP